jgi:MinD superfamily P-loop ATPase
MIKNTRIKIAVASGKGGTGKTFISTNLFYVLQKNSHNTILIDCDAEAPDVLNFFNPVPVKNFQVSHQVPVIDTDKCTYCSKCREYCNYNAIFIIPPMKMIKVIEELCHGCGACSIACTFGAITEKPVTLGDVSTYTLNGHASLIEARMRIGAMSPVPVIKAAIKEADPQSEIIILDSPPGTSCPFIHTVKDADYVVLVTEPTPFGLSDLRQSIETLKTLSKSCGVIINRSGIGNDDVREYLDKESIRLLLEIPFEREISELYSGGSLVSEKKPELANELYAMIRNIMQEYGNSSYQR